MSDYWEMTYGDALKDALEHISSNVQRMYFLSVFQRMGEYVIENDADGLTFREYFDMFER
ncbi:MAG: hypothetical protein ACI4VN_03290 [Clostridia bacterium]|nr:hypothetical protein [Clostridia bacterium]